MLFCAAGQPIIEKRWAFLLAFVNECCIQQETWFSAPACDLDPSPIHIFSFQVIFLIIHFHCSQRAPTAEQFKAAGINVWDTEWSNVYDFTKSTGTDELEDEEDTEKVFLLSQYSVPTRAAFLK